MYRTRSSGRSSVMVINPLVEDSPRCPPGTHPALLPHQLADLHRMKRIELECADRIVPRVCFHEGRDEGGAPPAGASSESGGGSRAPDALRATVRMGILADKPGAGKSYTIMEILLEPRAAAATDVYHHVSSHMSYSTAACSGDIPAPVSVLVFPHNLAKQWRDLLAARVPENRLAFVSRSTAIQEALDMIDSAVGYGGAGPMAPAAPSPDGVSPVDPGRCPLVVATTATNFSVVMTHLKSRRATVLRIVYDEADSLRLPKMAGHSHGNSWVTRFHWFVTASPHNLYSVLPERGSGYGVFTGGRVEYRNRRGAVAQSLMYGCPYVHSGYVRDFFVAGSAHSLAVQDCLCAITVMSDDEFVESSFDVPPPLEYTVHCQAQASSSLLHGIVDGSVIERLNAGDIRGALSSLNPTCVSSETNVVSVAAESLQSTMRNLRAQLQYTASRTYVDENARGAATARIEGRMSATQSHIDNLERRIKDADVCPICYDDRFATKTVSPCCSNSFCLACISKWLVSSPTCPMCKAGLAPSRLIVICPEGDPPGGGPNPPPGQGNSNSELPFPSDSFQGKIANLRGLVRHFSGEAEATGQPRRVLIFSDNDEIMNRVSAEVMSAEEIRHSFLKSNSAVINARTRDFRETTGVYALLTNIKYYGSGLDLSAATDIVLMHKVQDNMAAQVIGRAQRPPRTQPLRIWKFRSNLEEEF